MAARSVSMKAVLVGGALVGVLDGLDAVVALKVLVGLGPIKIYQFVASGLLGPTAFAGGGATALLGLFIHFLTPSPPPWCLCSRALA